MFEGFSSWLDKRDKEKEVLWGYCESVNTLKAQINKAIKTDWALKVKHWTCKYVGPENQCGARRIAEGIDLDEILSAYVYEGYSVRLLCQVNFSNLVRFGKIIYENDGAVKYRAYWSTEEESNMLKGMLKLSKSKL